MKAEIIPTKIWLPQDSSRTPGVHVSKIIRGIALETGILDAETLSELSLIDITEGHGNSQSFSLLTILRMSIGLAWDEYYIPRILGPQGISGHPGEMEVDGIYMSPDAESVSVIVTDLEMVCHEVKATYKSTKTVADLKSQWMWMTQIKAYCKAMHTRHACLHVLFLNGDYSWPMRPRLGIYEDRPTIWQIEFTEEEIDESWELLKQYRDQKLAKAQEDSRLLS